MSANINLLLRTDEESLKRKKRIKILNFIATVSLVSVCLISICIFIAVNIINIGVIKKKWNNAQAQMLQFQGRQSKLFVLNNRIENVDKILKTRKDFAKVANSLIAKMPSQFSIDNLRIDDKSVIISGQSMSLSAIGELINNLTDMARKKEIIKSLTLSSLVLDPGRGVYQISIKSQL
jgi:hypothetical protein